MPVSKERFINRVANVDLAHLINPEAGRRLIDIDLDFRGVETQHSTHAIHTYLAAINPPLARLLIDSYVPKQGIVLDPFCGGGGVLVETLLSNRSGIGIDVNPLAYIISKTKTKHISEESLIIALNSIEERIQTVIKGIEPVNDKYLKYWFKPDSLAPLLAYSKVISEIQDEDIHIFFTTILSATIRDVMLTYRGEVRLRHLVEDDLIKFHPDPFVSFKKRAKLGIQRVSKLPTNPIVDVRLGSATNIELDDNSVDAIICSPPYADDTNGVGYFQFSKYMLRLLGWTDDKVKVQRNLFLGGNHRNETISFLPSPMLLECTQLVQTRSQRHSDMVMSFYSDYLKSLSEMCRVTNKWVIIVIGDRVISRTSINNGQVTYEFCRSLNMVLDDYYTRTIPKKRIRDMGSDGGGINKEHVLIFRKA